MAEFHPKKEVKYKDLSDAEIPASESLACVVKVRTVFDMGGGRKRTRTRNGFHAEERLEVAAFDLCVCARAHVHVCLRGSCTCVCVVASSHIHVCLRGCLFVRACDSALYAAVERHSRAHR